MSIMLLVAMSMFAAVGISLAWNLIQVAMTSDTVAIPVAEVITYENSHFCHTCGMRHGDTCPNAGWNS